MEPRTCPHSTCGHTWTPRKAEPKKCPQCQNPLWRSSRPKKQRVEVPQATYGGVAAEWSRTCEYVADEPTPEPECVRAPEPDPLAAMKNRADSLLAKLI